MMKKIALICITLLLIVSCGSRKKIVTKKRDAQPVIETRDTDEMENMEPTDHPELKDRPIANSTQDYIDIYKSIAISEMKAYGIPASITLAQAILESGSGKGRLASEANNHFGIKCHGWTGETIYHDDDRSQECFRKYKDASYSFRDHSEFLAGRKRYGNLFKLKKTDYKGWAKELRRAGYATDKKYPQKLIALIERFELYQYDEKDTVEHYVSVPDEHIVIKGDTLYSISKRYNLPLDYLKRLNGLEGTDIKIGQRLYLKYKE